LVRAVKNSGNIKSRTMLMTSGNTRLMLTSSEDRYDEFMQLLQFRCLLRMATMPISPELRSKPAPGIGAAVGDNLSPFDGV
jgi:hypothetical protein